jgi:zinc ribbon protein
MAGGTEQFCEHCGSELSDTALFCAHCGKPVSLTGRVGRRRWHAAAAVVVLVLIAGGGAAITIGLTGGRPNSSVTQNSDLPEHAGTTQNPDLTEQPDGTPSPGLLNQTYVGSAPHFGSQLVTEIQLSVDETTNIVAGSFNFTVPLDAMNLKNSESGVITGSTVGNTITLQWEIDGCSAPQGTWEGTYSPSSLSLQMFGTEINLTPGSDSTYSNLTSSLSGPSAVYGSRTCSEFSGS